MQLKSLFFIQFMLYATFSWGQETYFGVLYNSCETDSSWQMKKIPIVELISFGTEGGFGSNNASKDNWPSISQIDDYTIDSSIVIQRARLNKKSLEALQKALSYKPIGTSGKQEAYCFTPRHGLIIRDRNKKIIEIMEICFECETLKIKKNYLQRDMFCLESLQGIKELFLDNRVDYKIE